MPDANNFDPERRSAPARMLAGLPILSTEKLTAAEREALRELRRRFELAVQTIADCLECGRVDRALDGLGFVALDTDGLALRVAAKLGTDHAADKSRHTYRVPSEILWINDGWRETEAHSAADALAYFQGKGMSVTLANLQVRGAAGWAFVLSGAGQ